MQRRILPLSCLAGILLIPALALTQDAGPGPEPRGRGFDPAQARERMLNNIKEQLGATADQWKTLEPKIEKIMIAQRDMRGGMMGAGRPGGPDGGARGNRPGGPPGEAPRGEAGNPPLSKVAEAQRDLRTALDAKDTPEADIAQKLAAYREARDKARAELQAAQKDLKDSVKGRQEAILVMAGVLE